MMEWSSNRPAGLHCNSPITVFIILIYNTFTSLLIKTRLGKEATVER